MSKIDNLNTTNPTTSPTREVKERVDVSISLRDRYLLYFSKEVRDTSLEIYAKGLPELRKLGIIPSASEGIENSGGLASKFSPTIIEPTLSYNPRRVGTFGYRGYNLYLYLLGKTIKEGKLFTYYNNFSELRGRPRDLKYDLDRGFIRLYRNTDLKPYSNNLDAIISRSIVDIFSS